MSDVNSKKQVYKSSKGFRVILNSIDEKKTNNIKKLQTPTAYTAGMFPPQQSGLIVNQKKREESEDKPAQAQVQRNVSLDANREMNKGPLILSHKKNNPSANYYIKGDFPQKKDKEVNLSQSIQPRNLNNSGIEQAAKNGLNQSRGSINKNNSGVHNSNFRIGVLSNNVSREYSRKRIDLNASEERSRQGSNPQLPPAVSSSSIQKNSGRVLISRNGSPKPLGLGQIGAAQDNAPITSVPPQQPTYYHSQVPRTTAVNDYNAYAPDQRGQSKPREEDKRMPETQDPSDSAKSPNPRTDLPTPGKEDNGATVYWADRLNGQDIRTELKFGDCLGQGSFAKVYEGFDKRLKMPVAIKVIDKRKIKDTETKKKALIEEEIYIFSKMNHPGIAKFIRLVEDIKRVDSLLP